MARQTIPADIRTQIGLLIAASAASALADDKQRAKAAVETCVTALGVAILHHLRAYDEMKAALEQIEQGA